MESKGVVLKATPKKRTFLQKLKGQSFYQAMVWPGIILMIIFNFIPLYGIVIALPSIFKSFLVIQCFGR